MNRLKTWDTVELDVFLRSRATAPFAWGSNDCCLFAADGVQAITGTDIADDFRGKYGDQKSAMELIRSVTGVSTVTDALEWCATKHNMPEWPYPLQAQRGDLVAVSNGGTIIGGIVDLSGRVACMGEGGLFRLSLSSVVKAWHVGA